MSVSNDAVRALVGLEGRSTDSTFQPILQVINIKAVSAAGGNDRYRVVLSDGTHYVQGMLATQLNAFVQSQELKPDSLIQMEEFMNNNVQSRTVIIILKMSILPNHPGQRIGSPVDIEKAGGAAGAEGAASAPVAAKPLYNSTNATGGTGGGYQQEAKNDNNSGSGGGGASNNNNPYGSNARSSAAPSYGSGSGGNAPIVRDNMATAGAAAAAYTPISQLNMYNNKWTIRARLTSKSDVRTWSNAKGEGSLFSIELLDSSGMDIRGTFFKEGVDKFYNVMEVGKVYTVTGGRLKVANMQWNTCKSNFEITFDQNSEIHLDNDTGDIVQQSYELVKISELEQVDANKNVDVLAVVKAVAEPVSLISKKSGNELTKCDLTLVDDSGVEVNLTLWGEKASRAVADYAGNPVVAFRRARVSDYGGKSLSGGDGIDVNPDIAEAKQLQSWWQASGSSTTASRSLSSSMGGGGSGKIDSLRERKDIASIKNENLGYTNPDKPDWLSFKATLTFVKKDKEGGAWYPACANSGEPCKNRYKVTQTTDSQWYCDKCQGTYQNCVRRWIFSGVVEDGTSSTWVSFFNEQAETLFAGATADDVYNKTFAEGHDQDAYDSYFARANFGEFIFKCKVKNEMVNDESRVKTSVYSLHPVDYAKESNELLAAIQM